MKIGIYPGSFDPFHIGHNDIYYKAKKIFDEVIILRAVNPDKGKPTYEIPKFIKSDSHKGILTDYIDGLYEHNPQIKTVGIIRGFRNTKDIESIMEQDYWLRKLAKKRNFGSIFIECDEELKHISSTVIKQLQALGQEYKHLII